MCASVQKLAPKENEFEKVDIDVSGKILFSGEYWFLILPWGMMKPYGGELEAGQEVIAKIVGIKGRSKPS